MLAQSKVLCYTLLLPYQFCLACIIFFCPCFDPHCLFLIIISVIENVSFWLIVLLSALSVCAPSSSWLDWMFCAGWAGDGFHNSRWGIKKIDHDYVMMMRINKFGHTVELETSINAPLNFFFSFWLMESGI